MFDKKGAHYGLQVFTRSRNYFTLYKSAGAFDKKGTDAAGRWRASGRITVGTCRSRHSDRDIISAVCSGDWCGRSDVLCRYGDRYQRTESMRKGILYYCTLWSTGTACGWICYGIFVQSAGDDRVRCISKYFPAEYFYRSNSDSNFSQYYGGDIKRAWKAQNPFRQCNPGSSDH